MGISGLLYLFLQQNKTPLEEARARGNEEMIKLLEQSCAEGNRESHHDLQSETTCL